VILRVVSGRVRPGQLDDVVESYRTEYAPIARGVAGLDRYIVAARPVPDGGHAIAAMTLWTTVEDALAAYAGDLASVRTVDAQSHGEAFLRVDYYEVDEGGARRRSGTPTRLRLTAGTVARGLDADIQQDLRRSLPALPPETTEAWVGRRVLGADVEIALITTWSEAPPDIALDAPLWPAISTRYDTFRIEVHDIFLEGSGRAGPAEDAAG
jgi:hypothetical protein